MVTLRASLALRATPAAPLSSGLCRVGFSRALKRRFGDYARPEGRHCYLRAKYLHEGVQRSRELSKLLIDEARQENRPGLEVILHEEPRN